MSDQRIPISQLSETQTAPDASYIAIDDGSLTKKITVENFNSTSTASAQQYANQAAASAQTVEDNIATSAAQIREATLAAREATQASTAATASATSAYDSASLAQNYSVNAATSAGQAMNAADTVAQGVTESKEYAEDSEAWAVGKRNGSDVPASDETYQNNAKYYAGSASGSATRAETAAQSINVPDTTLTVSGVAADSKTVGDIFDKIFNTDIFKELKWEDHKTLNTSGIIRTAHSTYAAVATKKLPKGTVIEGTLYAIPTTEASYTRVMGLGSKNISWGAPIEGTSDGSSGTPLHNAYPVSFSYTVLGDWEWVWFSTAATDGDNSIRITLPTIIPEDSEYYDLDWHFGYIPKSGIGITDDTVYVYSDPIQASGYKRISANLVAPSSVTVMAFADADTGLPTDIVSRGLSATTQREYRRCLPENAAVVLCTKTVIGDSIVPVVSNLNISVTEAPEIETDIMATVNSGYIKPDGSDGSGGAYKRTTFIILMPGQTIRFAGCVSSSGLVAATYSDNAVSAFVAPIVTGDKTYRWTEYTAGDKTEFIRICSCVGRPSTTVPWVKDEATFRALCVRYYAGNRKDPGNDRLYGKTITFMGDSLAYGNKLGPEAVWLQKLAFDHNMTAYNLGINANSVSTGGGAGSTNAMVTRYNQVQESDFFVLIGGANDRRLGVPVGTVSDTTQETFCGALNIIIDGLRAMYPTMRMLFLTNYNRYSGDLAYVEAMKEVCAEKSVPCFDNFHNCGLTFMDSNLLDWIDEGLMLNSEANHHFSVAGYEWIEPIYENLLKGI